LRAEDDPVEYIQVAEESGIHEVRAAIPMPNARLSNSYVGARQLGDCATLLAVYVAEGHRRGIQTMLVKPFPLCKLPEAAARVFLANGSMTVNCPIHALGFSNNLSIYPDLSFSPCLGVNLRTEPSVMEYGGPRAAAHRYRAHVSALIRQPLLPECTSCPLRCGGRCVGACLSYRLES
jgi:hypothetical protein